jgi:nucleotide-binding universal stress UspA family protein
VRTLAVEGPPVPVLDRAVAEWGADLLVVGNVGLNTLAGRLLGSVPRSVARRAGVDVLIVHTS